MLLSIGILQARTEVDDHALLQGIFPAQVSLIADGFFSSLSHQKALKYFSTLTR